MACAPLLTLVIFCNSSNKFVTPKENVTGMENNRFEVIVRKIIHLKDVFVCI